MSNRRLPNLYAALAASALALVAACSTGGGHSGGADGRTPAAAASASSPAGSPAAPSRTPEPQGEFTMAFAGDVHFTDRTEVRLDQPQPDTPLGPMAATLGSADISMVNFESAITTGGSPQPKLYHFRAPATALDALEQSHVTLTTMANNHAVDYGPQGLADTLAALRDPAVPVVGIGPNADAAYRPWTTTVNGVRVAVLAASQVQDITNQNFRAGPNTPGIASALQPDRLITAVRNARRNADVVIVYLHWGTEGQSCPGPEQKSIAKQLSDAGATAVVGTHAHVMLGSGMLGNTYVAYGYGNFLWYGTSPYPNSDQTGVDTLTFRGGKVVAERFTPAVVDGRGVPMPQSGAAAQSILDRRDVLRQCTGLTAPPTGS